MGTADARLARCGWGVTQTSSTKPTHPSKSPYFVFVCFSASPQHTRRELRAARAKASPPLREGQASLTGRTEEGQGHYHLPEFEVRTSREKVRRFGGSSTNRRRPTVGVSAAPRHTRIIIVVNTSHHYRRRYHHQFSSASMSAS